MRQAEARATLLANLRDAGLIAYFFPAAAGACDCITFKFALALA